MLYIQDNTGDAGMALMLVGASPEKTIQLQKDLSQWNLVNAPNNWPDNGKTQIPISEIDAVLVFAQIHEESRAFDICQKIKHLPEIKQVPLLLVINRFQMMLGHDVKKLTAADFIISPFDQNEFKAKLNTAGSSET
jgi:response regulator RpfG family c-di-GMP phosphodiesterase